jgi:hypothetical protein
MAACKTGAGLCLAQVPDSRDLHGIPISTQLADLRQVK